MSQYPSDPKELPRVADHVVDYVDLNARLVSCEVEIKNLENNKASKADLIAAKYSVYAAVVGVVVVVGFAVLHFIA
ncbi:MAG: hypothetical protein F4Z18_09730 [Caldilineaceae bacterium SB0666_bin_21]|nr:hypothetical protein [Caldilineaceae bacterium SB0666_bin_21]